MARINDITGLRFGMLVAEHMTGDKTKSGNYIWHCKCDCGKEIDVSSGELMSGHTRSCGCRSFAELEGQRFGKLTVIRLSGRSSPSGGRYWLCRCDCGNYREVSTHNLKTTRGGIKACEECAEKASSDNREKFTKETLPHQTNVRRERLHGIWVTMKSRCNNPNVEAFKHYGQRGISVCREWNNSYMTFKKWALANGYNDNLTIERIDVNGDYCPENCTWIEMRKQFFNKTNTHFIEYEGKKIPVSKMVYDLGLDYSQIIYYLKSYDTT